MLCGALIRKSALSLLFLVVVAIFGIFIGNRIPKGFLPEEDQGYMYINVALPDAASLQRTDQVCRKIEEDHQEHARCGALPDPRWQQPDEPCPEHIQRFFLRNVQGMEIPKKA